MPNASNDLNKQCRSSFLNVQAMRAEGTIRMIGNDRTTHHIFALIKGTIGTMQIRARQERQKARSGNEKWARLGNEKWARLGNEKWARLGNEKWA